MTAQVREAASGTQIDAWLAGALPRLPSAGHAIVSRAAGFAKTHFSERLMPTGESYLNHAREVATILMGMSLDVESIAAGLLAGLPAVKEDATEYLRENLSAGVSQLVDGVAAMAHIQSLRSQVDAAAKDRQGQLETLRKMLLAMVQDVRVVLIKLADQTQQLRYLAGRGDEAQRKLAARDATDLFAPLANRLGVWQLKWELEDLAFRCNDPDTYKRIARELDEKRGNRESFIAEVTQVLRTQLKAQGIAAEVTGRPKHIFSIYRKMQRKDLALKNLFDVRGVRILVQDIKDCYAALGLVHGLWTPLPKEFDDYIAKPKPNNYQSLHTAVTGPDGKVLEVQIRTHEMHRHGELGVAAHWRYKEGVAKGVRGQRESFDDKIAWLRQILDWREGLVNAADLAQHFRHELFDDTVYVLTPQGRVVDLPKGSTPVDFAYHLHTELGHRCRGAKVNGAIVPLSYALANGQTVEIISAKVGGPSRDWLNPELHFVASGRARSKVRQWFNAQNHEASVAQGRQVVDKELQRMGMRALSLEALAGKLNFSDVEAMLLAVGKGDLHARPVELAARALRAPAVTEQTTPETAPAEPQALAPRSASSVLVLGVDKLLTVLARCCKPVPPDPIIGFVTRGKGVTVHRARCPNAARLSQERTMEAQWGSQLDAGRFPADIEIQGTSDSFALRDVLDLLARERVPLLSSSSQSRGLRSRYVLTVEVPDLNVLKRLIAEMELLASVSGVRRE